MASKPKILFIGSTGKFIVEASAKAGHPTYFLIRETISPTRQSPKSSRTSRIWAEIFVSPTRRKRRIRMGARHDMEKEKDPNRRKRKRRIRMRPNKRMGLLLQLSGHRTFSRASRECD